MKAKEEILQWLRQHDWYLSFEIYTVNFHSKTLDEYLSDMIIKNSGVLLIKSAFYWSATKEGVSYWSEIDKEYCIWLKSDNINKMMKQTIEIEVPEGKKAVWKDNKVIFEDIKPELPKTWEEFCEKYSIKDEECFIRDNSDIGPIFLLNRSNSMDKNVLPTKEAAESHLALMQLHQLRDCYRQGWKPDWENKIQDKYYIANSQNLCFAIYKSNDYVRFLSFPTKAITEEFLHNFEDLIKKAGDLI